MTNFMMNTYVFGDSNNTYCATYEDRTYSISKNGKRVYRCKASKKVAPEMIARWASHEDLSTANFARLCDWACNR